MPNPNIDDYMLILYATWAGQTAIDDMKTVVDDFYEDDSESDDDFEENLTRKALLHGIIQQIYFKFYDMNKTLMDKLDKVKRYCHYCTRSGYYSCSHLDTKTHLTREKNYWRSIKKYLNKRIDRDSLTIVMGYIDYHRDL